MPRIHYDISDALHRQAKVAAARRGQTLKAFIEEALATASREDFTVWEQHLASLEADPEYRHAFEAGLAGLELPRTHEGHPRSGELDTAFRRGRASARG